MSTLLITHPHCLDHLTPLGHPERPERLRAIEHAFEIEKFQSLARVQAPKAPLDVVALCHPMEYITQINEATPMLGIVHLDADTSMSPGTFAAALRAADGLLHFRQCRHRGALRAEALRHCARCDRRLRRAPRQRLAGNLLGRQDSDVLLDPSDAALSRYRRRQRNRRIRYGGEC